MRYYKTIYVACESSDIAKPGLSHTIRLTNPNSHYYNDILSIINQAFWTAELIFQDKFITEPYHVSLILEKVSKFKKEDEETNLDRIEWIIENALPPKCGLIFSIYISDEWFPLARFRPGITTDSAWPTKQQWIGDGDYVAFQLAPRGQHVGKRVINDEVQSEILKILHDSNIKIKHVNYTMKIQEAYDILLHAKEFYTYIGGLYFIATSMNVPIKASGRGCSKYQYSTRYSYSTNKDLVVCFDKNTNHFKMRRPSNILNIGKNVEQINSHFNGVKIYCLYYEGKYSKDYVSKLYRSLKRNCKLNFKFICLSDSDVEADEVIPLEKESIIAAHWHKLRFFDKEFTGDGEIIVMDIDQIIVSDITSMVGFNVKKNELVSYEKWWSKSSDRLPINGGWYKFKAGSLQYVWDKYNSDPKKWQLYYYHNGTVHFKYFGEQNFVYDTVIENKGIITQMPGKWVGKYDKDIDLNTKYNMWYAEDFNADFMIMGDEISKDLKIVHFANVDNTIHQHPDKWIKKYWY